jgi:uncharacterized protein
VEPLLDGAPYGCAVWPGGPLPFTPFATLTEAEEVTVVAPLAALEAAGQIPEPWARISLARSSDLAAVRLTAAFVECFVGRGDQLQVIAGYHHDHIVAHWGRREDSVAELRRLLDA